MFPAVIQFTKLAALGAFSLATLAAETGHPPFLSPHSNPIAAHDGRVFVANTPSDTVDVIDSKSRKIVARINVGIAPVCVAVRPDGAELWVANHVSDSVSVIDLDRKSPTHLHVIATVQDFNWNTKATRFDEPVGIAFADNAKAYIALSSENKIAVVDVAKRTVRKRLDITAQDPRAIAVRDGRLYVIPFESNNQTQLSGGYKIDGELVTFNAHEHSIANNNVLSLGHVTDIVKHPRAPDHDLYVFDTKTDKLIETVDTLGTLLYGLAVDSKGRAFIAQTDARNDANGRSGTKKHGLAELENRPFLNQITRVAPGEKTVRFDLEPLPPEQPKPDRTYATPFAIQVTDDDKTLVVTAAGSDKLFTVDAETGEVLGQVNVDAVPRGIALDGSNVWVLNAVDNSVSLVDATDPNALKPTAGIALHDPTHPTFKRGRIAFETAAASTTYTFSCASCHPNGHTDQLLWVLETPIVTGGDQIMPRSTMPLRGLRDTAPFHWDGIPGDPYGGTNSASVRAHVEPNSRLDRPESATRHVIDGSMATTMTTVGSDAKNDEGKAGALSAADRDAMAEFLLGITYPPAQRRAYDNVLSKRARDGFKLFHIDGNHEDKPKPNVCGDCHRMPFWVSTNTPGSGMDTPTWRGAYDRFLILPQGRLNIIDFEFYRRIAEAGHDERSMWRLSWRGKQRFDPVWEMVLEGSTGFSGSFARQVTLNKDTARDELSEDLLDALEASAGEGAIALRVDGTFVDKGMPVSLRFDAGRYLDAEDSEYTREQLATMAAASAFVGTFTGRHGPAADHQHPQPGLWTRGPIQEQRGRQEFPVLHPGAKTMSISGRHLHDDATLIVDGRQADGTLSIDRNTEHVEIALANLPDPGMHFLQVQNPGGLFSNDFIFHVAKDASTAEAMRRSANPDALKDALAGAIARGDTTEAKRLIDAGAPVDERQGESASTPLSHAAFFGHLEIIEHLLENGARVSHTNRDGNTALHTAAFLCRTEIVELLLAKGASTTKRSDRRQRPIDTVNGAWSDELAGVYTFFNDIGNLGLDLADIERRRPQIAKLLREHK